MYRKVNFLAETHVFGCQEHTSETSDDDAMPTFSCSKGDKAALESRCSDGIRTQWTKLSAKPSLHQMQAQ